MAFADRLPLVSIELLLATISIGLGTVLPVTTVCIQNAVGVHELGTATASMNFFRQLGGAFIVAIFGTIVLNGAGLSGADMRMGLRKRPRSSARFARFFSPPQAACSSACFSCCGWKRSRCWNAGPM